MQAALFEEPEKLITAELPVPVPMHDEVLIEVAACGVCGTDLHIFHGQYTASYPIVPGHEFSGTVVSLGDGVKNFRVGDRVTVDPNIPCNRCSSCHRNQPTQCRNMQSIGGNRNGAFAQYVVAPETNVFSISQIPFEAAAFLEPLSCIIWGIKRIQVQPGDSVLLFGAGPIGCMLLQTLRNSGAAIVVATEKIPWRLNRAIELGATESVLADEQAESHLRMIAPSGYDLIIDATGDPAVYSLVFDLVRPLGKVLVFGVCPPNASVSVKPFQIFRNELTIVGSHASSRTFQESISLLQNRVVKVEPLISHRLPLARFKEALEIAEHETERMKVQITL